MTVGKDVSMLFPDIIKNMENPDIELKKLVYLYIINYAKKHPEKAVMVVNTFRKDATNKQNPLLRSLAVRTMGCINVPTIN
jgi:AP-1 complex subunit beta-1